MRILLDECVPVALKRNLASLGHECQTVREAGFAGKKNGKLLTLAESWWDVLLTSQLRTANRISTRHDWAKSCLFCQPARKRLSQSDPGQGSGSRDVLAGF